MKQPTISIIIVSWNGKELLERFLPSVVDAATERTEILVADNASSDDTVAWLAAHYPSVRIVRHPENRLYARGNNDAVPATSGDVLCFLNNDVEVSPNWLAPILREFEDASVVAVQPKLLQHDDRSLFEYAGASGGFLDAYGYPFTRGRIFDTLERDRGQYNDARDIFWATGAALFVRRDAFLSAGGFDVTFGMHMEEIDLCWRLQRAGGRVRVAPRSTVYHLGGASLPQGDPGKAYLNFRNGLLMLAKNLPEPELRRVLRARRALDAVARVRAVLGGSGEESRAIQRAWRDFRAMRTHLAAFDRGGRNVLPPYRGSVVVDYFLRGKKTFDQLEL